MIRQSQRSLREFDGPDLDWDDLLASLKVGEILVLEQVYIVENGPLALPDIQKRLIHLNVHRRTIGRYCLRLKTRGLVKAVSSWDLHVNPIPEIEDNIKRLVRLWQLREKRSRFGIGGRDRAA